MTDRVLIGNKNVPSGTLFSEIPAGSINFDIRALGMTLLSNIPESGTVNIRSGGNWYTYDYAFFIGGAISQFIQESSNPFSPPPVNHLAGDKVVVGSPTEGTGIWVSKPTANVLAMADVNIPDDDWYGFQEEFDWTSSEDEVWANSSPGENRPYMPANWPVGLYNASPFGFVTDSPPDATRAKIRRTTNNTLLYTGGYGDQVLRSPYFVSSNGAQVAAGGHGYNGFHTPFPGDIHPNAIYGADYPMVEMRIRRLPTPNYPTPNGGGDFQFFWADADLLGEAGNGEGSGGAANPTRLDGVTITPSWNTTGYPGAFPHDEISPGNPSPWKIIEWDLSAFPAWGNMPGARRVLNFRMDLTHGTPAVSAADWNPETHPMWEIDYVRVKKASIPPGLGRWNSKQGSMLFDSDSNHTGLVHQTGIVTIGTAKAWIDGTTSDRVVGHNIDNDANGYVSFPELDYIPLVLFQRIDENVDVTGTSYPGGEQEFSICTQNWEDHRHPTYDMNTSESSYKGFDIKTVNKVDSSVYTSNLVSENFYFQTDEWPVLPGDQSLAVVVNELPWLDDNSSGIGSVVFSESTLHGLQSERRGNSFSSMVQSFSETRTFAYARAKKDGFWLTCRNAIAQEGMEPALNLAPVLPEAGVSDQGLSAYTSMASNNDNGAWGMFHPALALYDGNKFAEGLQLKWDTRTTANSFLLEKVGTDETGVTYPQYKWWPNFSCSGLPFNGILAFPNDPAPPNKLAASNWLYSYTKDATTLVQAQYTTDGILRGDTGGFYPYRFQKNNIVFSPDGSADSFSFGDQYNIKRLSSAGIFHPPGTVPSNKQAYDNKNTSIVSDGNTIENQTAYIGGAMNTKTGSVASYDATKPKPPKYKYWVLRVPVSIPEYTA